MGTDYDIRIILGWYVTKEMLQKWIGEEDMEDLFVCEIERFLKSRKIIPSEFSLDMDDQDNYFVGIDIADHNVRCEYKFFRDNTISVFIEMLNKFKSELQSFQKEHNFPEASVWILPPYSTY